MGADRPGWLMCARPTAPALKTGRWSTASADNRLQWGENERAASGVGGHSATVEVSRRQPALVSSLLIGGQGLHGQ